MDELTSCLMHELAWQATMGIWAFDDLQRQLVEEHAPVPAEIEARKLDAAAMALFEVGLPIGPTQPQWAEAWRLREAVHAARNRAQEQHRERMSRFRFTVQGFLVCAANVSKVLWPPKNRPRDQAVAAAMRLALHLDDTSPLRLRNVRNSMEHHDERIEALMKAHAQGNGQSYSVTTYGSTSTGGGFHTVSTKGNEIVATVTGRSGPPDSVVLNDLAVALIEAKAAAEAL